MSTDTTVTPLRQRMIEDMTARKLGPHSQRSYIHSCRRFAAFLKRSPDTATADDVRLSQLHLADEAGLSICNRKSPRGRRAPLLQRAHAALPEAGIHCLPQATTSLEVGGLRQATIRWARARLTLYGPL